MLDESALAESARITSGSPISAAARLEPLRRVWNPLSLLAIAIYRVATGGPASAIRVIFARAPLLIPAHLLLLSVSEYGLSLDKRLRALARVHGSRVNGCRFCDDLESRVAIARGMLTREDVDALADWRSSDRFTPRERAALAWVEEVNSTRTASDEAFAALRGHLSEKEVVELTWLNAVGNYLNLQARPLGLEPEGSCAVTLEPAAGAR